MNKCLIRCYCKRIQIKSILRLVYPGFDSKLTTMKVGGNLRERYDVLTLRWSIKLQVVKHLTRQQ